MKSETAVKLLDEINGYPEDDHMAAEETLCYFLKENGFSEVAEAFERAKERCHFWYA